MIDRLMNAAIIALILVAIIVVALEWARDKRSGQ